MKPWTEYVYVEVTFFKKGGHPWTMREFLGQLKAEGHIKSMNLYGLTDGEFSVQGDIDMSTEWWINIGDLWNDSFNLDRDLKLDRDIARVIVKPMTIAFGDRDKVISGLLETEVDNVGPGDVFEEHVDDIVAMARRLLKEKDASDATYISMITTWECDAGMTNGLWISGHEEYESHWSLKGVLG